MFTLVTIIEPGLKTCLIDASQVTCEGTEENLRALCVSLQIRDPKERFKQQVVLATAFKLIHNLPQTNCQSLIRLSLQKSNETFTRVDYFKLDSMRLGEDNIMINQCAQSDYMMMMITQLIV